MFKRFALSLLGIAVLCGCQVRPQQRPPGSIAPSAPLEAPAPLRAPTIAPAIPGPSGVFGRFLDAVREGDAASAWEQLSEESQAELGGTAEEFAARAFAGLKVRYGLWEGYRVALDHLVSPNLAVVSITGRRTTQSMDAVAAAVVRRNGTWRLALHADLPVKAEQIGPDQIALRAPGVSISRIWLDNQSVEPTLKGGVVTVTVPPLTESVGTVLTVLTTGPRGVPGAQAFPASAGAQP